MRINKTKKIIDKSIFTIKTNSSTSNNKNQVQSDSDTNNNKPLQHEAQSDTKDLSSPIPSFLYQKNPKKKNQNKLYDMLEVEFDKENFRLFFYVNEEDNLVIELIPKDGNSPFSYKNIFDEEKFYKMNKIFMELKTVEKIGEKIINLFKKEKVLLGRNKKDDIFYLILKITVIDEDTDIYIPLNKNEDIQLCTINYLLKEAEKLKKDFRVYKNETEKLLNNQKNEINELKKANSLYLKIIKKIRNSYENKNEKEENNKAKQNENEGNIIIIKENKGEEKNLNNDEEDEELKKIDEIIIDENEEYKIIEKKIEMIEEELKSLDRNYKCDINAKYKILNLSINQTKPYAYIYFEFSNIGLYPLTTKLDDIFCNLEDINENSISFYDEQEKYIFLSEPLLPNHRIIISKKIKINNPTINRKYDFVLNIYSLNHGKISEEPIKFNIFIRESDNQNNFLSFLRDKKFKVNPNFKNKNNKIILEYASNFKKKDENNFKPINLNKIQLGDEIKIRKFIYDEKSGMALENKNKNINNIKEINEVKDNNHYSEINIMINNEDIDKLVKKIKNKYKQINEFDNEKIEEIICSCIGDFKTICTFIEKMV